MTTPTILRQIVYPGPSFQFSRVADARNRGVGVRVILDKSQRSEKYSSADFVAHAGILTLIDATVA